MKKVNELILYDYLAKPTLIFFNDSAIKLSKILKFYILNLNQRQIINLPDLGIEVLNILIQNFKGSVFKINKKSYVSDSRIIINQF